MARNRTEKEWRQIIDGTKTAKEIAYEAECSIATVYVSARKYNLPLKDSRMSATDYHGIPVEQLKEELSRMPVTIVAHKYGLDPVSLRSFVAKRNIPYFQKIDTKFDQINEVPDIMCKRPGKAKDMIRTLCNFYTDASIAHVFGCTRQYIYQIRKENEKQ